MIRRHFISVSGSQDRIPGHESLSYGKAVDGTDGTVGGEEQTN